MLAMAKLMEMKTTEPNKISLYLFNNIFMKNNKVLKNIEIDIKLWYTYFT